VGTLYVVGTPIGNLEDVSYRLVRILRDISLLVAEDTRTSRKLLSRYDLHPRLISYNEHNHNARIETILKVLDEGDVALISEAGTPVLNDPGYRLVQISREHGHRISPVPGPSALATALSVAGMSIDSGVFFLGFLPRRSKDRLQSLTKIAVGMHLIVAFEVPHRLKKALIDISETLGDREIAVCRELTKMHEEVFRGSVSEAITYFENPIGEFTLVIAGHSDVPEALPDEDDLRARLRVLRDEGLNRKEAIVRLVDETRASRRNLYRLWLDIRAEE
jgi:16S rRNA (cytidine1402-2'-O)-methyltransferase